ncbi:hypothetical protein [Propionibacterium australiense]|uniref:hypothetical protein n=1 Tax=Propionibacterium australiense TaxID=119981 RepID=UPI0011C3EE0C|nr:hypothetical protein [Propionibacterium australiense]
MWASSRRERRIQKRLAKSRLKHGISTLSTGDVFFVGLDASKGYLGWITAFDHQLPYIVIFDRLIPAGEASRRIDEALNCKPLLAGMTTDALFRSGGWVVVGNRPASPETAERFLPAYLVRRSGQLLIEDFHRYHNRPAEPSEELSIPPRRTRAPIGFQRALQAINGRTEWHDSYSRQQADKIVLARDVFGSQ